MRDVVAASTNAAYWVIAALALSLMLIAVAIGVGMSCAATAGRLGVEHIIR